MGFTLRFIVPAKWQSPFPFTGSTEVRNNDARFRVRAKSNTTIFNNNGGNESYIEMAKGDVLELYCYIRTEYTQVGGGWASNNYTEYYIKSRMS